MPLPSHLSGSQMGWLSQSLCNVLLKNPANKKYWKLPISLLSSRECSTVPLNEFDPPHHHHHYENEESSKANRLYLKDKLLLEKLEIHLAGKNKKEAIQVYNQLQKPPSQEMLQKLVVLVVGGKNPLAQEGFQILSSLYNSPDYVPDEYSPLAFIYVMDACCRQGFYDHSMNLFHASCKHNISMDLPAYNAILQSAIQRSNLQDALLIFNCILKSSSLSPNEHTFTSLLLALFQQGDHRNSLLIHRQMIQSSILPSYEFYDEMSDLTMKITDPNTMNNPDYIQLLAEMDEQLAGYAQREIEFSRDMNYPVVEYLNQIDDDDDDDEQPNTTKQQQQQQQQQQQLFDENDYPEDQNNHPPEDQNNHPEDQNDHPEDRSN